MRKPNIIILGIIAGVSGILSGLLWWYMVSVPGLLYGISIFDPFLWDPLLAGYNMIMLIFLILLLASGFPILIAVGIYGYNGNLSLTKKLSIVSLLILLVGFFGELIAVVSWAIDIGWPLFLNLGYGFVGLGLGLYLGIVAVIVAVLMLMALKKLTLMETKKEAT